MIRTLYSLMALPWLVASMAMAQPLASPPYAIPAMQALPLPGDQVSLQWQGQELTRLHFSPGLKRPFLYPIQTSLPPSLVRMGHPHDPHGHRHHYGVWLAHANISGVNFWGDAADNGKDYRSGSVTHQRVLGLWDGEEGAAVLTLNHWVADRDQRVLLLERRYLEARPLQGAASWLLIIESEFTTPKGTTTTFEASPFGLCSVRLAKTIGVRDGGGRVLNSEQQVNEAQAFRQHARWCDYTGPLTTQNTAGITLLNHPDNPHHPTHYHIRDDGWMCASLSMETALTVSDRNPLRVRYGLWIHEGAPDSTAIEAIWKQFAALPSADLDRKP